MQFQFFRACSFEKEAPGKQTLVYDMQLMPHPTHRDYATVFLQRGYPEAVKQVKGESVPVPLTARIVCEHVNLLAAQKAYDRGYANLKKRVGFVETALRRMSSQRNAEVREVIARAARTCFDGTRFEWPEHLRDMVEQLERTLSLPSGLAWQQADRCAYESVALLVLADASQGLAEGPDELLPQVSRALQTSTPRWAVEFPVFRRLSAEMQTALQAQPSEEVARELLAKAIAERCALW